MSSMASALLAGSALLVLSLCGPTGAHAAFRRQQWVTNHILRPACLMASLATQIPLKLSSNCHLTLKIQHFVSLPMCSAKIPFKFMMTTLNVPGTIVFVERKLLYSDLPLSNGKLLI